MDTKINIAIPKLTEEQIKEIFESFLEEEDTQTQKDYTTKDLLQKLVNYLYENVGKNPIEETEVMLLKVLLDEKNGRE